MENKDLTVIVVNDFDYVQGGASKIALDTAQTLYDNGINVIYFSATHQENDYKFKQVTTNQKECLKDGIKGAIRSLYNFKAAKEFKKILKTLDRNKTVIHVHGWTKSLSSSIFRVAGQLNFKVVLTLHDYFVACPNGGFFNYKKCEICKKNSMSLDCIKTDCDSRNYMYKIYRITRQFIQNSNIKKCKNLNLINISDFSFDILKKYFDKNISIKKIYNPISVAKKSRTQVEKNDYYVYVGRISPEKGVNVFCESIRQLNLKAIVVGDGDQRKILEKKYKNDNIKFVGWCDSETVNKYLRNSKCLVFTSLLYETMGLSIVEAKSNGVPCIVSKLTAGSEFVKNGEEGFLYDGTIEDLNKKISLYEKSDIKKMSENSYEKYWQSPYDKEKYFCCILEYYKQI